MADAVLGAWPLTLHDGSKATAELVRGDRGTLLRLATADGANLGDVAPDVEVDGRTLRGADMVGREPGDTVLCLYLEAQVRQWLQSFTEKIVAVPGMPDAQRMELVSGARRRGLTIDDAALPWEGGNPFAELSELLSAPADASEGDPTHDADLSAEESVEKIRADFRDLAADELARMDNVVRGQVAATSDPLAQSRLGMLLEFLEEEVRRRHGTPYGPRPQHGASDAQKAVLTAVMELTHARKEPTVRQIAKKVGRTRHQTKLLVESCIEDGLLRNYPGGTP